MVLPTEEMGTGEAQSQKWNWGIQQDTDLSVVPSRPGRL